MWEVANTTLHPNCMRHAACEWMLAHSMPLTALAPHILLTSHLQGCHISENREAGHSLGDASRPRRPLQGGLPRDDAYSRSGVQTEFGAE